VNAGKQWREQHFAKGVIPPFSFVYGGEKSDSFIKNWQYQSKKIVSSEPGEEKYLYSYSDKATGLVVKCTVTCFTGFPAVEWVLHFENTSGKNTPLIEQAAAIDHSFTADGDGTFILHHYQLHRPKEKDGIILAFRRADNQEASLRIKLSGLVKDAVYELYDKDSDTRSHRKGSELMDGLDIALPDKPVSLLLRYRQTND
jgi:hypothetical protein